LKNTLELTDDELLWLITVAEDAYQKLESMRRKLLRFNTDPVKIAEVEQKLVVATRLVRSDLSANRWIEIEKRKQQASQEQP
jgi:predicted FMN-binding regulatory protein PaiB